MREHPKMLPLENDTEAEDLQKSLDAKRASKRRYTKLLKSLGSVTASGLGIAALLTAAATVGPVVAIAAGVAALGVAVVALVQKRYFPSTPDESQRDRRLKLAVKVILLGLAAAALAFPLIGGPIALAAALIGGGAMLYKAYRARQATPQPDNLSASERRRVKALQGINITKSTMKYALIALIAVAAVAAATAAGPALAIAIGVVGVVGSSAGFLKKRYFPASPKETPLDRKVKLVARILLIGLGVAALAFPPVGLPLAAAVMGVTMAVVAFKAWRNFQRSGEESKESSMKESDLKKPDITAIARKVDTGDNEAAILAQLHCSKAQVLASQAQHGSDDAEQGSHVNLVPRVVAQNLHTSVTREVENAAPTETEPSYHCHI